jgi:pyruvate/2-oxoglutarate/acetoin dehydrogenase E1 component
LGNRSPTNPSSYPYDAKGLLTGSLRDFNPLLFVEYKVFYTRSGPAPEDHYLNPLGKEEVEREGSGVTLISYSLLLVEPVTH